MRRHVLGIGLAAGIILAAAGGEARGRQEAKFDRAVFDRETAAIKKLGKTAMPVYSFDAGKTGTVTYANGKLSGKDGATIYLAPLGWASNSSFELGDRLKDYVLVGVGPPVRVGDAMLNKGEYAVVRDGKLVVVTAADLKK